MRFEGKIAPTDTCDAGKPRKNRTSEAVWRTGWRTLMATISKRNGSYRAEVRLSGHPRESRSFASRRAAERWSARREREIRTGHVATGQPKTLADVVDVYLEQDGGHLPTHTKTILSWWRKKLGKVRLSELKRSHFYDARDSIRGSSGQPLSPATINKRMAAISAVLTHAMHRDWISINPARIRRLKEANGRERLLTPGERKRLLEACEASREPHLFMFVICAMVSGARAGELQNLTWEDVDLERGLAYLAKTKTGLRRPIALRGRALELLQEARKEVQDDHRGQLWVFRHKDGRGPFQYRRSWDTARRQTQLVDLHLHDLRHLAASELAQSGASLRELQQYLGHSNPAQTSRYSHFVDDATQKLGDQVSDRLFGGSSP